MTKPLQKGLKDEKRFPESENKLGLFFTSTGTRLSTWIGSSRTTSWHIHLKAKSSRWWRSSNSHTSWTGSTHSLSWTSTQIPSVEILSIPTNSSSRQLSSWIVPNRSPRPTGCSAGITTTSPRLIFSVQRKQSLNHSGSRKRNSPQRLWS